MSNENRGGFIGGFVVGALVGGAVAAVVTREETRDMFIGKAREASNFAADATSDLYERGRHVVENARSNFGAAVDEGVSRAEQIREELSRKAEG